MKVEISVTINAPLEAVWYSWITPSQIKQWNFASDEWTCPNAENNLVVGESFNYRMEAKDGSMGFDFKGTYTNITTQKLIEYMLEDDRKVWIIFEDTSDGVVLKEYFEAEDENSAEMQKQGWQSILQNFKLLVEKGN